MHQVFSEVLKPITQLLTTCSFQEFLNELLLFRDHTIVGVRKENDVVNFFSSSPSRHFINNFNFSQAPPIVSVRHRSWSFADSFVMVECLPIVFIILSVIKLSR